MLKFFAALLSGLVACTSVSAQAPVEWQAGKHYTVIEPAQTTSTGDKIEVLEVFSYGCTHCNTVAPLVEKMHKALPANAEFVLMPAQFGFDAWKTFARAFYTGQALGLTEKSHLEVFRTIYVEKKIDPTSPKFEDLATFYSKYGVSAADFTATSTSFAIETRLKRNDALVKAYGVDSTPTFIVNGKYRLSGQSAGGYEQIEPLVKYLIAKETAGG
ncbi:MAG: thiol:disulfide interchange protein DsbA/DsbL [Dokdonella sp.]